MDKVNSIWKYNLEKHSVYKFDLPNASHKIIPVSGKVDWKDGEDVTGKFVEDSISPNASVAIPIKQEQPQGYFLYKASWDSPMHITNKDEYLKWKQQRLPLPISVYEQYEKGLNQLQEQPIESEMSNERIEEATMWCEIIVAIGKADKNGENVGSFIPRFLEPNYTIKRKT